MFVAKQWKIRISVPMSYKIKVTKWKNRTCSTKIIVWIEFIQTSWNKFGVWGQGPWPWVLELSFYFCLNIPSWKTDKISISWLKPRDLQNVRSVQKYLPFMYLKQKCKPFEENLDKQRLKFSLLHKSLPFKVLTFSRFWNKILPIVWVSSKKTTSEFGHFTTISGNFFVHCIYIFHKT